jgi:hypothetical protein
MIHMVHLIMTGSEDTGDSENGMGTELSVILTHVYMASHQNGSLISILHLMLLKLDFLSRKQVRFTSFRYVIQQCTCFDIHPCGSSKAPHIIWHVLHVDLSYAPLLCFPYCYVLCFPAYATKDSSAVHYSIFYYFYWYILPTVH